MNLPKKVIKFSNNRFYISPEVSFNVEQTNINPSAATFSSRHEFYWEVEIVMHDMYNEELTFVVIDYFSLKIDDFNNQFQKRPLRRLKFINLEFTILEQFLTSYRPSAMQSILKPVTIEQVSSNRDLINHQFEDSRRYKDEVAVGYEDDTRREKITKVYDDDIYVKFDDLEFRRGFVSARINFKKLNTPLEIQILNENVIPEYGHVKKYFSKILVNHENFPIRVKVTLENNIIAQIEASSEIISKINDDIIGQVKIRRTKDIRKVARNADQELYSIDELLIKLNDGLPGKKENLFTQSEEDIIQIFIENNDIRNKRQLRFLLANHSKRIRIHFTLEPIFGFLFVLEGNRSFHFCWELLDSHATYIWSASSDMELDERMTIIEEYITTVHLLGRQKYKQGIREGSDQIDGSFIPIYHRGNSSDDGFNLWLEKIGEIINS